MHLGLRRLFQILLRVNSLINANIVIVFIYAFVLRIGDTYNFLNVCCANREYSGVANIVYCRIQFAIFYHPISGASYHSGFSVFC